MRLLFTACAIARRAGLRAMLAHLCLLGAASAWAQTVPETVHFMSRDGVTQLTGYLYRPAGEAPDPALVMLHGRAGPYSSLKRGVHRSDNLTLRHRMWGEFWADHGYVALHVDSYGPRGFGDGFPRHSYAARPAAVGEQTVRPLDAYGALDYLRSRSDVRADRIGVQGWSNGGMAVLAAMAPHPPGYLPEKEAGFRAALALYPGCTVQLKQGDYRPYAPLLLLAASEDNEVLPQNCARLADAVRARGGNMDFILYEGAQHSFDDPGKTKQRHAPNRDAMLDSLRRAETFFRGHLQ